MKQSGKMIAVPIPVDKRQSIMSTLIDSKKESSIVTIVRGNNYNKPIYKDTLRSDVVKDAIDFLVDVNKNYKNESMIDIGMLDVQLANLESGPNYEEEEQNYNDEHESVLLPEGTFAPGSSSHPINFIKMKKPYSKILPTFFPLEQDDLDYFQHQFKITEGQWVAHMLRNVKKTLSENSLFVFGAAYRLDMSRLESASYVMTARQDGCQLKFPENDATRLKTVYFNLPGSKDYYIKQYNDLIAKSSAFGYPEVFYTFRSSNEWDVTLATSLSQDGFDIWHSSDERSNLLVQPGHKLTDTSEGYFVHISEGCGSKSECPYHPHCKRINVRSILGLEQKQNLLKRNLYNEQRLFDQRLRSLINIVLMSSNSKPRLSVVHTIKEFAEITGKTHAHGVGWLPNKDLSLIFGKLHQGEFILKSERQKLINFADTILTSQTSPEGISNQFWDINDQRAEDISCLAKKEQVHVCSGKCDTGNISDGCLYHFPRLPSIETILSSFLDPGIETEEAKFLISCSKDIKMAVRNTLKEYKNNDQLGYVGLTEILIKSLGDIDANDNTQDGTYLLKTGVFPDCRELQDFLVRFVNNGSDHPLLYAVYHTALSIATWKVESNLVSQVILKRAPKDSYVMDYNPYCLEAIRSNMAMELVTHTPLKVIDYMTKAKDIENSSHLPFIEQKAPSKCRKQIIERVRNHRKVSANEAFYRIDNTLRLSETNADVLFVNVKFPEHRFSTLFKVNEEGFKIPGKDGLFMKNKDVLDKYSGMMR